MTYASNICLYAHMIDNNGSISTYIHTYTHLTQNICTQKSRNRHTVFYIVYAYVSTQLSNSAISIYQHTYSHIHLAILSVCLFHYGRHFEKFSLFLSVVVFIRLHFLAHNHHLLVKFFYPV